MVAITIVLAAVVWIYVSGMVSPSDEQKTTVTLEYPDLHAAEAARYSTTPLEPVFDATLNILKVSPNDEAVLWTEVRLIIKSSNGSLLLQAAPLLADGSLPYDTDADGTITVQAWYIETMTGDTKMSASDIIKITGMSTGGTIPAPLPNYEGATVELLKGGERIAEATLPTDFI